MVGIGSTANWPRDDAPFVPAEGLRDKLLQLRQPRWLSFTVSADVARVTYGDAIREIGARWGLELSMDAATSST